MPARVPVSRQLWPAHPPSLSDLDESTMRFPRFRIRTLMIAVAGAGLVFWLILAADQIRREPNASTLCHLGRFLDNGESFTYGHASSRWIFWSKYWRKVLGQPWPGSFACPCKAELEKTFGRGRKVEYLATSNGMNEMHELLNPLQDKFVKSRKRKPPATK
jgi:hypothetical protein